MSSGGFEERSAASFRTFAFRLRIRASSSALRLAARFAGSSLPIGLGPLGSFIYAPVCSEGHPGNNALAGDASSLFNRVLQLLKMCPGSGLDVVWMGDGCHSGSIFIIGVLAAKVKEGAGGGGWSLPGTRSYRKQTAPFLSLSIFHNQNLINTPLLIHIQRCIPFIKSREFGLTPALFQH